MGDNWDTINGAKVFEEFWQTHAHSRVTTAFISFLSISYWIQDSWFSLHLGQRIFFTDKAKNGGPGLHFEATNAFLETQGPYSAQWEAHSRTGGNKAADDTSQGGPCLPSPTQPTAYMTEWLTVTLNVQNCYFFIENPPMLSYALCRFSTSGFLPLYWWMFKLYIKRH